MDVKGRNLVDGLPKNITISSEEVREALAVRFPPSWTPSAPLWRARRPELSADIIDNGIMLTGGGAMLRGLDVLVSRETGMPVHVAENPLDCVAIGTRQVPRHRYGQQFPFRPRPVRTETGGR